MDKRLLSLVTVLGLSLSGCGENVAEVSNQCKDLYKNENYNEALPVCEKACDLNDGYGCLKLGGLYHEGKGVTQAKE